MSPSGPKIDTLVLYITHPRLASLKCCKNAPNTDDAPTYTNATPDIDGYVVHDASPNGVLLLMLIIYCCCHDDNPHPSGHVCPKYVRM